jgi:glycosyltransferase involved in cell wall biosynthesis
VSAVSALPELAGDAAIVIDPEDVGSIEDGLERLLANPALRKKLAAEGRRRAANYSWVRAAAVTRDVLGRIATQAQSLSSRTIV